MPDWHFKFPRFNAPARPWDDRPLPGREITGPVIDSIASVAQLRNVALGAEVDEALFAHMASAAGRQALAGGSGVMADSGAPGVASDGVHLLPPFLFVRGLAEGNALTLFSKSSGRSAVSAMRRRWKSSYSCCACASASSCDIFPA